MRRRALLAALMGWLFLAATAPNPANAQATPDQLNRLSLEALTAPPPPRPRPAPGYHRVSGYHRASTGRSYGRRTRRSSYRAPVPPHPVLPDPHDAQLPCAFAPDAAVPHRHPSPHQPAPLSR